MILLLYITESLHMKPDLIVVVTSNEIDLPI